MTTTGIETIYLESHNWGKTAKFFQALGFELEFETGHASGQLRNGEGPYVFVAEVPEDHAPTTQVVLKAATAETPDLDPSIGIVSPFADPHFRSREMVVRDPDGRLWTLQASAAG
jgi:hypothetical protein